MAILRNGDSEGSGGDEDGPQHVQGLRDHDIGMPARGHTLSRGSKLETACMESQIISNLRQGGGVNRGNPRCRIRSIEASAIRPGNCSSIRMK